jgi:hypothetical protein
MRSHGSQPKRGQFATLLKDGLPRSTAWWFKACWSRLLHTVMSAHQDPSFREGLGGLFFYWCCAQRLGSGCRSAADCPLYLGCQLALIDAGRSDRQNHLSDLYESDDHRFMSCCVATSQAVAPSLAIRYRNVACSQHILHRVSNVARWFGFHFTCGA